MTKTRKFQIFEAIGIIVLPIFLWKVSGVTDVLVSEMLTIPLSLCFFTGKGIV